MKHSELLTGCKNFLCSQLARPQQREENGGQNKVTLWIVDPGCLGDCFSWIIDPSACDWLKMRKASLMIWISLLVQGQFCMDGSVHIWLMHKVCFVFVKTCFCSPPWCFPHTSNLCCCTLCSASVSHGAQGQYARKLLNDLMEGYSNALRPVEDTDKALNVSLQITLSQIKDMVSGEETQIRFITQRYKTVTTKDPLQTDLYIFQQWLTTTHTVYTAPPCSNTSI